MRLIHPRAYEVLDRTTRLFHPDFERVAGEVRGELDADKTLKRWLFGSLGNDPEAMRNLVPSIACLVCVTLRPGAHPEIKVTGPSGSPWFDRAATDSLTRGAAAQRPDEPFDPARACYRFAAKVWRTRPDLTNLLAVPFKLNFSTKVQMVSYQKVGG